jgi:hypothetical protein
MPVIKLYQHGSTSGTAPLKNTHERARRSDVQGWTPKTARSNTAFLRSVTLSKLWGHGFAFTLTLKTCPPTHEHWQKLRKNFVKRLMRNGLIRLHWVTEWQRRGVPHLHGVAYFETKVGVPQALINTWVSMTYEYGSREFAQDVKPINDSLGWLKYLAKHASRGASHYQRSPENIPEGWLKTGRIWGKSGDWPTEDPLEFELDNLANFAYRRIIRRLRIAEARTPVHGQINSSAIRHARSMLKSNNPNESQVRGTSIWLPLDTNLAIMTYLKAAGHDVSM